LENKLLTGVTSTLGPACPPIHSIHFVDDLIICDKANIQQVQIVTNTLQSFCAISGQTPN
jgi:hypothetical protein